MEEKIITVLSNASLDHYPDNKISNFRNKLYVPISLATGEHEIAILSCSYNASPVIVAENEDIGSYTPPDSDTELMLRAPFAITSFEQLFAYIERETGHSFTLDAYGFVEYNSIDPKYKYFKPSKRIANLLGITAIRYGNKKIYIENHSLINRGKGTPHLSPIQYSKKDITYWLPLEAGETEPNIFRELERMRPGLTAYFNVHNGISVTMSTEDSVNQRNFLGKYFQCPKLLRYLGTSSIDVTPAHVGDFKSYTGLYRPISNLGTSQLLVYCDLIHPQHIGNTVAPLLRSFQVEYGGAEHVFNSPIYFPIARDYIDVIHMYIMCENGEPPPFEFGTFTATLGIRKRISQ